MVGARVVVPAEGLTGAATEVVIMEMVAAEVAAITAVAEVGVQASAEEEAVVAVPVT